MNISLIQNKVESPPLKLLNTTILFSHCCFTFIMFFLPWYRNMKKEYNYLNELTDKSDKYKVKVKVIQKARPYQSPGIKKFQKLILQDDKVT